VTPCNIGHRTLTGHRLFHIERSRDDILVAARGSRLRSEMCRHFVTTRSKQMRSMHTQVRKRWRRAHPKEAAPATASFASRASAKLIKAQETFISPSFPVSLLRLTVVATTVPNLEKSACSNAIIGNDEGIGREKEAPTRAGVCSLPNHLNHPSRVFC
jgi:hypothetical protein